MKYAILFFLSFGSSSKVFRELGDDRRIHLLTSTRSKKFKALSSSTQQKGTWTENAAKDCPSWTQEPCRKPKPCSDSQVDGDCGCTTTNTMYVHDAAQKKEDDYKIAKVDLDGKNNNDDGCRYKCIENVAFVCRWWVWRENPDDEDGINKPCVLYSKIPGRWKQTSEGDVREAGPPCGPPIQPKS